MSSSWYKSGNIIHTWSLLYISKLSRMSLNFGDISGVELREKPQDESDLEDEVFFKNGKEDLDKTNDNNKTVPVVTPPPLVCYSDSDSVPVVTPPPLVYSDSDEENDDQTSTPARTNEIIK